MSNNYNVDEMLQQIKSILPETAKIIDFTYSPECFGNIYLCIKINHKKHTFVVDKNEIYHNNTFLESNEENNNIFSLLLQQIKKLLV